MLIKLLKQLALASTLALASLSAHASTYHYENTSDLSGKWMDSYSTTWDESSETLSIDSTWATPTSGALTKISFLISDGGSPWLTVNKVILSDPSTWIYTEQFLWYEVDLASSVVTVKNYFKYDGKARLAETLDTFTGAGEGVAITANSLNLTLDHTYLNGLSFTGMDYRGAGFSNDIGVWYYMDNAGGRVETLDVHHGTPSAVPVPAALFLFAPALAGFATMRRKLAKS